jgi:hypothetical protein
VVALVLLLALPVLGACSSGARPLCDQAAKLADEHHPTAALGRYLEAERAGEGGCAADGQRDVQEQQSRTALVLARAAAAEQRGATREADDLYAQVLTQDVDSAEARAGLARLQADIASPAPTPSPQPVAAAARSGLDPFVLPVLTVLVVVGLATGVIVSLMQQRDRPRVTRRGPAWGRDPQGDADGRVARLETQVAFLLRAVDALSSASAVSPVRTVVVPPTRPPGGTSTTSVTGVTVVRLPSDTLLVVCRRIVHEPDRPEDPLVTDIARLGSPEAPHLGTLLEEAAIAAATKGRLDQTWRVVQEAWQLAGPGAGEALVGQVRELLVGRPVVLPPSATALPAPLDVLADRVASGVETPGDELERDVRVLVQATGITARPVEELSVVLTAVVRSLRFDLTADALATALRDSLRTRPEEVPADPTGTPSPAGIDP